MIRAAVLFALLIVVTAGAQDLPDKPTPHGDPPLSTNVSTRNWLYGGEAVTPNNVWAVGREDRRNRWEQRPIGSCAWCGAPLTWRAAAFDKRALPLWLAPLVAVNVDTAMIFTSPCIRAGTCREANPLLGNNVAQQTLVKNGVFALGWLGDAWLRKGSLHYRVGGWRRWWLVPLEYGGIAALDIAFDHATIRRTP